MHASVILDSGPKFQESEPLEVLMRFPKSCLKKTGLASRRVLVGTNVMCPADDRLSHPSIAAEDQGFLFPVKCEQGAVLDEGAAGRLRAPPSPAASVWVPSHSATVSGPPWAMWTGYRSLPCLFITLAHSQATGLRAGVSISLAAMACPTNGAT